MTTRRSLPAGGRYGGTAVAVPDRAGDVVRQNSTTHGGWTANVGQVLAALATVHLYQGRMEGNLTAADGSESQIEAVIRWADHVTAVMTLIREGLGVTEETVGRYVDAVDREGGPSEVGSPAYHADY